MWHLLNLGYISSLHSNRQHHASARLNPGFQSRLGLNLFHLQFRLQCIASCFVLTATLAACKRASSTALVPEVQGLGKLASLAVHHMSAFWRDNADILKWDKISQRLRNAQNGTLAYGALNSTDYFSCTIIYWFKKKHFLFLFGAILFRYRRFKYKDICEPPLKYAVCFFCVTPLCKQLLFTNLSMVHGLCTITWGSCLAIYAKSEFAPVLSRYI